MNVIRRFLLCRRIAHYKREIAHLELVRERLGPALDNALRQYGHARVDLAMMDVRRPPITHAAGEPRRDGVVRKLHAERERAWKV